jgi:hypothetical protein
MKKTMSQRRPGFTLVEMLVATALIMFIMLILSQAFVQGIDAFRLLKGIGDMEEGLRTATGIMRDDLVADHFEGRRRLSDPSFASQGEAYPGLTGFYHPREGFFSIVQGATPTASSNGAGPGLATVNVPNGLIVGNVATTLFWQIQPGAVLLVDAGMPQQETVVVQTTTPGTNSFTAVFAQPHPNPFSIRLIRYFEGIDADGLPSYRAVDHQLNFTVKLRGNRRENFFSANLSGVPTSPPWPFVSPFTNPASTNFFLQSPDANFQDFASEYASQWAEVAYFLVPNGTAANGTPLYALYRCQYVIVPDNRNVNGNPPNGVLLFGQSPQFPFGDQAPYAEMSCQKASGNYQFYGGGPPPQPVEYLDFNNPSDVSQPTSTLTYSAGTATPGTAMVAVQTLSGPGWQIQPGYFLVLDGGTSSAETVLVSQVNPGANPPTFNVAQPLMFNHPNPAFPIQTVRRAFLSAQGTSSLTGGLGPPSPLRLPAWPGGNRLAFTANQPILWGATLLLTDVVSFDVQVFPDLTLIQGSPPISDFVDLSAISAGTYDTGAAPQIQSFPLKAIQITLRVWNFKTQQTRQITMIQDM